jgi:hypothetical protein
MSDRLKELQRQRALAQEQLAWFDREIARETGALPAAASLLESKAAPIGAPTIPATRVVDPIGDIISRYNQETPGDMAKEAKRGCMLYFIFAFIAFGMLLLGVYLYYTQFREAGEPSPTMESQPGN